MMHPLCRWTDHVLAQRASMLTEVKLLRQTLWREHTRCKNPQLNNSSHANV